VRADKVPIAARPHSLIENRSSVRALKLWKGGGCYAIRTYFPN
jgi:hypothetical protein